MRSNGIQFVLVLILAFSSSSWARGRNCGARVFNNGFNNNGFNNIFGNNLFNNGFFNNGFFNNGFFNNGFNNGFFNNFNDPNNLPIFDNGLIGNNGNSGNFGNFGNFGNRGAFNQNGVFDPAAGQFGNGFFGNQFGNNLFNQSGSVLLPSSGGSGVQVQGDGAGNIVDIFGRRFSVPRDSQNNPLDRFGNVLGVVPDGSGFGVLVRIPRDGSNVRVARRNGQPIRVRMSNNGLNNGFNNGFNNGLAGNVIPNFGNIDGLTSSGNRGLAGNDLLPRNPGQFGFVERADARGSSHDDVVEISDRPSSN